MTIPKHLIETAWRRYEFDMVGSNIEPSKLDFFLGFGAAVGMLFGSMGFGIPPHTNPLDVMQQLMIEFHEHGEELREMEIAARDRTLRLNKTMM